MKQRPFLERFLILLEEREAELEHKIKIINHLPKRVFAMETLKQNRTLQVTIRKQIRGF